MKLTKNETQVLAALRNEAEGETRSGWMQVYLPNAKPNDMTAAQFAGVLSNLKQKGLYESQGDNYFGEVAA